VTARRREEETHDADEQISLTTIGRRAKTVAVLGRKVVGIAAGSRVPHVGELGGTSLCSISGSVRRSGHPRYVLRTDSTRQVRVLDGGRYSVLGDEVSCECTQSVSDPPLIDWILTLSELDLLGERAARVDLLPPSPGLENNNQPMDWTEIGIHDSPRRTSRSSRGRRCRTSTSNRVGRSVQARASHTSPPGQSCRTVNISSPSPLLAPGTHSCPSPLWNPPP
jgi:hypothetical protein